MIEYMKPKIIQIKSIESPKGVLSVIDNKNNLPFEIKRIFYVYNIPQNSKRGDHAHKNLKELIWVLNGEIEVSTISQDKSKAKFILNKQNEGLYIPERTWSYQVANSQNCIYCVACSDYYDEGDYIRNWNDFVSSNFD